MKGVLAINNGDSSTIRLVLEPSGDDRPISSGSTALIPFSGPDGGRIEIKSVAGCVVVYGWEGSILEIAGGSETTA